MSDEEGEMEAYRARIAVELETRRENVRWLQSRLEKEEERIDEIERHLDRIGERLLDDGADDPADEGKSAEEITSEAKPWSMLTTQTRLKRVFEPIMVNERGYAPRDEVIQRWADLANVSEEKAEERLHDMNQKQGHIYEPKQGFLTVTGWP